MTGVLFSRFLDFIEEEFGQEAAQGLGADRFTPGAAHEHGEILELAVRLGERSGRPPAAILRQFGRRLFHYFARMYPAFFAGADSALGFLGRIDTYIHGELSMLYPNARFPHFDVAQPSAHELELVYRSRSRLADLAEGLIDGCAEHFGESISVRREDVASPAGEQAVRFRISRG
jgi:hypothetical protein